MQQQHRFPAGIVAFRGERGSYNTEVADLLRNIIVAFRGERGSYNRPQGGSPGGRDCSLPG